MSFFSRIILTVVILTAVIGTARAQDEQSSASTVSATTASGLGGYAARPLTVPKGHLRIDVAPPDYGYMDHGSLNGGRGLRVLKPGEGDAFVGLGAGAAYGIMDELEVGGLILPFVFAPDFDFGDMELYGRYAFVRNSSMQLGAQAVLRIPTASDFGLGLGVPAQFQLGSSVRLDTGAELELIFADNTVTNLDIPLAVNVNLGETAFIGGRSGFIFADFEDLIINLGIQGGIAVAPMVELSASLNFPYFIWTGPGDALNLDIIEFMAGATIHLNLL